MSWSVGIDVGGTVIKAVAAEADGTVLMCESRSTNDETDSVDAWTGHARGIVAEFEKEVGSAAASVGVCAPGLAASDQRSIAHLPGKLEGLERFDWTEALGRESLVPVLNDAHAALLGEAWVGAARGRKHVVLLTLGTGVGGAIMSDGRLLKGAIGRAGHLGHMSLDVDGPPSITGMPGAIEVMIGDCSIRDRTAGRFASTKALVDAHRSGDAEATRWWLRSMRALGCAIGSYINIADPEVVVLAGGIATAGDSLMKPLRRVLDEVEWRPGGHAVPIVFAALGEWAGALGAARAAITTEI